MVYCCLEYVRTYPESSKNKKMVGVRCSMYDEVKTGDTNENAEGDRIEKQRRTKPENTKLWKVEAQPSKHPISRFLEEQTAIETAHIL